MATYVNAALTGNGSVAFAGGSYATVTGVYAEVITPGPSTQLYGFVPVQRVFQFAWMGIGFSAGGGYHESITWWRWLDVWTRSYGPAPDDPALGDYFWWDVVPGGVLRVELTY